MSVKSLSVFAVLGSVAVVGFPVPVWAALPCSKLSMSIMQPKIDSFLDRPQRILEIFPQGDQNGARDMEGSVRALVGSDAEHIQEPLLKLLPRANFFQKLAIGAGIADAAKQCERGSQPEAARRLITAIKLANDQIALTGFKAAYVDPPQASTSSDADEQSNPTSPIGRVTSPGADVFKLNDLRDPFTTTDPFAPMK